MSDREIWQVADFVSHMPHLPPELDREWKAPPKPGG
jgi:hypothetical protein